jgi:hypothetical protein
MISGTVPKKTSSNRSPNRKSTTYSALFLLAGGIITQYAPAAFCEDGFRLKQLSSACGLQYVLIAPHFFKVELPKECLVITGAAPNWKIVTMNTRSKLYCETPLNDFKASYITTSTQLHLTELSEMREISNRAKSHKTREGLACIDYPVGQIDDVFNGFKGARAANFRVLDDPTLPAAAARVVKKISGISSFKTNLFPLALELILKDGMRTRFLWTSEVQPEKDIKSELVPKNYKRVNNEIEVFRDAQVQEDIREMLETR